MFDPEDQSWLEQSIDALNAKAEVSFSISDQFYRDPNNLDEEPLQLPVVGRLQDGFRFISVAQSLADPMPLIQYYKAVLKYAAEYSQTYDEISQHFWMRLRIVSEAGKIGFPWYDHLNEIGRVLDWLISAPDGDQWHDIEQGWELIAVRVQSKLHFREGLFDQGGQLENLAFSKDELAASAKQSRTIISQLMPKLISEIGEDYWTLYRYDLSSHAK